MSTPASRRRVLLTGAPGFIGSHLARLLVTSGHHVTVVVRPGTDAWRLNDIRDRIEIVDVDLSAITEIKNRLRHVKPDVCIHLAWKGWSGKAEADANLTSLGISLELLRVMPELGCPRFVAAGTCFEYALSDTRLAETTPLAPHDLYGGCKKSLFEVGQGFSALTGVSVVTPRIFYSYGPYEDRRRLVPSIVHALLAGQPARATRGEQVRDYLHVADIASAIWAVADSEATGAVNIASGVPVTIAALAMRLAELIGRPDLLHLGALPYRDGEPMYIVADVKRLRHELDWTPQFTLTDGLQDTVDWWRQRPSHD